MKILLKIFGGLLLFEIAVRLIWGLPEKPLNPMVPDEVLHHRWRPNLIMPDKARAVPYTLYTNSQGFVEQREILLSKPPHTIRMFFLGDSNISGVVDDDKKMVRIVERELNRRFADRGVTFELINAGVWGYSPLLYYLYLKTELMVYAPDFVAINVDMTDVGNDFEYRKLADFDEQSQPVDVRPPQDSLAASVLARLNRLLKWHSAILFHIEQKIFGNPDTQARLSEETLLPEARSVTDWLSPGSTPELNQNIDFSVKLVVSTIELLKKNGAACIVTGVPNYAQFASSASVRPYEILDTITGRAGAWYLNSYKALGNAMKGNDPANFYWSNDPTHFNIDGNKLWAQVYLDFLLDPHNGILASEKHKRSWLDKKMEEWNGQST